jgi:hypothetical protein
MLHKFVKNLAHADIVIVERYENALKVVFNTLKMEEKIGSIINCDIANSYGKLYTKK